MDGERPARVQPPPVLRIEIFFRSRLQAPARSQDIQERAQLFFRSANSRVAPQGDNHSVSWKTILVKHNPAGSYRVRCQAGFRAPGRPQVDEDSERIDHPYV